MRLLPRGRRTDALLWLAILTCTTRGSASGGPLCDAACQNTFQSVRFSDEPPGSRGGATRYCHSALLVESLYLCLWMHQCEAGPAVAALNETCLDLPPYEEVVGRWTEEEMGGLRRFNGTVPGVGKMMGGAVVPEDGFWEVWWRTLDASAYVNGHHYSYGWSMGLFWAVVVAIGVLHKIARHVLDATGRRSLWIPDKRTSSRHPWLWLKRRVLIPATFGQRCAESFGAWGTVPPRIQSVTLGLFVVLNVVASVHGYRLFPGNIYYPTVTDQVLRFVSDRTGIISFANFPLIWLFGMRNNVVMWLTGWDFGTYNNFHRWVARVATLQAVIHSVGYTVLILKQGGWTYFAWWWSFMFWWAGELATVFMCALVVFSFYWIRRQQYELFLIAHIVLSILLLVTMLGHVSIFSGEYDALVWVPALIWVFDRVLRALRIVAFNFRFWNTRATATFNPDTNIVRLEVPCTKSLYGPSPGTFFYLMVLGETNFWESHPFTLAGVSDGRASFGAGGEETPLLSPTRSEDGAGELEVSALTGALGGEDGRGRGGVGPRMVFLIRPYDDFTSRLRDAAAGQWPKSKNLRVLVDGPYGHSQPLHRFDRVIFVVGGSGIVVPLSYLRRLHGGGGAGKKLYQDVRVHWSVREPTMAMEVLGRDLADGADVCKRLETRVYLTGAAASTGWEVPRRGEEEEGGSSVRLENRRMEAGEIVRDAAVGIGEGKDGGRGGGSLAVVACGPARMADEARRAAVGVMEMEGGGVRVEYFEESFQW